MNENVKVMCQNWIVRVVYFEHASTNFMLFLHNNQ